MFKSIQYKLYIYTALLIVATAGTTFAFFAQGYIYAVIGILLIFLCLSALSKCYQRYNQNILFLLNALDNGDYSFHFSETKLSSREKEMNQMMNRIKEILANARKEVIENENFLSLILESVSTGIIILDDRGIVQKVNQAALDMLGLPVFSHINQLQSINETYPALFHGLKAGDNLQISLATEREEQSISLRISHIRLKRGMMRVITLNNIGNELEMKEMESWIRLIRVMTHEIMNSIAPITSLSETMMFVFKDLKFLKYLKEFNKLKSNSLEAFETINTTASGLLSFVESYRKFTSVPKPEKRDFNLNALIDKVIKLHEPAIKEKNIELNILLPEPVIIHADENLTMQVLINLVKNAIEAVEPDNREKIVISAGKHEPDKFSLSIANTGQPIPAAVLPHIFIPFFTTKASGSGIGLSVSRYIMRLHGGKLQHSTSKDGMTVFSMIF
ncbi:MAG: PAS domain-containing protein [Candidatus Symbiothrix sp.]|jgi:nitrogen fixation/metabolism regulation signal transduction histidine kinase|nr:PAS domain-containing protein [Candidatus Symbiothrix sp.]